MLRERARGPRVRLVAALRGDEARLRALLAGGAGATTAELEDG
jgi:hypothetical protein